MCGIGTDSAETHRLLEQVRAGDREAFGQLLQRHRAYLHEVISLRLDSRTRSRVDASDVVQETQLEAFRRLDDYLERTPMPFRVWLRKNAHQCLLDLRRKHVKAAKRTVRREVPLPERSSLLLVHSLTGGVPAANGELSNEDHADRVRRAVDQLDEMDREVLLMRHVEGLSHQEVAHVLDIEPAAARKRYGRALLRLRRALVENGLEDDGAE